MSVAAAASTSSTAAIKNRRIWGRVLENAEGEGRAENSEVRGFWAFVCIACPGAVAPPIVAQVFRQTGLPSIRKVMANERTSWRKRQKKDWPEGYLSIWRKG